MLLASLAILALAVMLVRGGWQTSRKCSIAMKQEIIGFHQDEEGDWVADLACGHTRHVRHNPPWMNRPWVTTPEGRAEFVGVSIDCKTCDEERGNFSETTVAPDL